MLGVHPVMPWLASPGGPGGLGGTGGLPTIPPHFLATQRVQHGLISGVFLFLAI